MNELTVTITDDEREALKRHFPQLEPHAAAAALISLQLQNLQSADVLQFQRPSKGTES